MRLPAGVSRSLTARAAIEGRDFNARKIRGGLSRPPFLIAFWISMRKTRPATLRLRFGSALQDGGSAEHAAGVQWFFKEEDQVAWLVYGRSAAGHAALPPRNSARARLRFSGGRRRQALLRASARRKSCCGLSARKDGRAIQRSRVPAVRSRGWTASAVGPITMDWCIT